jgi:hypothetical protein
MPDGRGDEAAIRARPLGAQVIVYFADTLVGLYQLRPWYAPLRELHKVHPVVVVGTDSRAVKAIRRESGLPAVTISHYSSIDLILDKAPVRLALYVNHNAANFSLLAFPQLVHVSIMHGDSDKVVTISGQTRAYDFTFVAGQAAVDRLATYLPRFDAAARCVVVGRPQAARATPSAGGDPDRPGGDKDLRDEASHEPDHGSPGGRITVLYAPTWEGGTASAEYSSLEAYGEAVAHGVLADQRFRLVFRPHPLTGTRLTRFAEAEARVARLVADAARMAPHAGHVVSRGGPVAADLERADLLVADVSSLAIDFLVTGRPLTVTVPPDPAVVVAPTPLLEVTPRLGREDLADVAEFLGELVETDPGADQRAAVAEYYLGDTRPGVATRTFVEACGRMIALADADWSRTEAAMRTGIRWPVAGPAPDRRGSSFGDKAGSARTDTSPVRDEEATS